MKKTYIIAGAGFRGFCDAVELLKDPQIELHIIDPAPFFGGIMNSFEIEGFYVDKGVHVFDSIPASLAEIVNEIMDGKTRPIDFVSASAFNGIVTEGFSLPDLSSLNDETKGRIARELIALAASGDRSSQARSLGEFFCLRYGRTAGKIFGAIFENIYGIDAEKIEPGAINQTSLGRLKFLDDDEMKVLKSHPWLETVLAARRKAVGKVDDYVSIYPSNGKGMRGWCERAARWLQAKGVKLHLGEKIEKVKDSPWGITVKTSKQELNADYLIWSNDDTRVLGSALDIEDRASQLRHGTPMIFVTLLTQANQIKDFTYIQNFDPGGLTYRSASAGLYSGQIKGDGVSFVTCECPVKIGSEMWNSTDKAGTQAWKECLEFGVVKESASRLGVDIKKIPTTFKLPMVGYNEAVSELREEALKKSRRIVLRNTAPFFRREIYLDSLSLRNFLN